MLTSTAADVLTLIGIGGMALYLLILALKVWLCRRSPAKAAAVTPDVTILQPILSGDPSLEEALRANLAIAPPNARFLWLIDHDDDEAKRLTDSLTEQAKGRVSQLVCPPAGPSANPKTFKLELGLALVTSPFFAVLDDDTILGPETLSYALQELETCALYTGLPCYLPGLGVWSNLVAHFVNNNSILTYLALQPVLGPLTINGMFYVMRTSEGRAAGGFAPMLHSLCDDYALAKQVKQHGGCIRQGNAPLYLRTTVLGFGAYLRLLHRWFVFANVLVRDQSRGVKSVLFVFLGLPPLLLWAAAIGALGGIVPSLVLLAGLTIRHVALRHLLRRVFGSRPPFSALLSLASELLQPFHWIHASVQRTIQWRRRRLRLESNGTFVNLSDPKQ